METLIDNRIFPQEMQEKPKPKPKEPKKNKPNTYGLVIFLLLIILGLAYYVLVYKKDDSIVREIPVTYAQEQSSVVEKLENSVPKMTEEERIERINAFFASE